MCSGCRSHSSLAGCPAWLRLVPDPPVQCNCAQSLSTSPGPAQSPLQPLAPRPLHLLKKPKRSSLPPYLRGGGGGGSACRVLPLLPAHAPSSPRLLLLLPRVPHHPLGCRRRCLRMTQQPPGCHGCCPRTLHQPLGCCPCCPRMRHQLLGCRCYCCFCHCCVLLPFRILLPLRILLPMAAFYHPAHLAWAPIYICCC